MNKKTFLAATIAAALSASVLTTAMNVTFAAEPVTNTVQANNTNASQANNSTAAKDSVKVSEDALLSMRDMHSARLAIFNGDTQQARTYVDAAVTRIDAASKEAEKYALDIKAPKAEDRYVPFDASMALLDTYKEVKDQNKVQDQARHIANANQHLHQGNQQKAIEELKLADIDVAITARLVPVQFAKAHITQAADLIMQGKYYEANLALKAVDDATLIQTFSVDHSQQPPAAGKPDASTQQPVATAPATTVQQTAAPATNEQPVATAKPAENTPQPAVTAPATNVPQTVSDSPMPNAQQPVTTAAPANNAQQPVPASAPATPPQQAVGVNQ